MLLTGGGQRLQCPGGSVQANSCSDIVFYWISSEKGVFCCHLVRTPWSLIQFKETARLLHYTANSRQKEGFFFPVMLTSPAAIFDAISGGVFHHASAKPLAWSCFTLESPPVSRWSKEEMVKTSSDWVIVTPQAGVNDRSAGTSTKRIFLIVCSGYSLQASLI